MRRLSLVTVLALFIGGLVTITVLTVVWSGYRDARAVLIEALLDGGELALAVLEREVDAGLDPVALSLRLEPVAVRWGIEAFVLEGDRVRAHERIAYGLVRLDETGGLPTVEALGDPVLSAYFAARAEPNPLDLGFRDIADLRLLTVDGLSYSVTVNRDGVGFYNSRPRVLDYADHLRASALHGLALVAVALVFAVLFAWRLSRPLARLGEAARRVAAFDLDHVALSERSQIAEVDRLGEAFDRMVAGLRWFESYMPKSLVQRLMKSGGGQALPSDEREMTVMFTDLAGFTTLSETLPANEVAELLDDHFAIVARCIEATGGTLDKFSGDAAMAFWGAPEPIDNHAVRAIAAAKAIRAEVARDNTRRVAAGRVPLQVRVGIHTGRVVVGTIGEPGRVDYTIVDDTVNVASRLDSAGSEVFASADVRIVISEPTVNEVGHGARFVSLGCQPVRGRSEPLQLFTLVPAVDGTRNATDTTQGDEP